MPGIAYSFHSHDIIQINAEHLCVYQLASFFHLSLTPCIVIISSNGDLLFYGNNPFSFFPFICILVCYLLFC